MHLDDVDPAPRAPFMTGRWFPDLPHRTVAFAAPIGTAARRWSAEAVEIHADRRRRAASFIANLEGVGYSGVCLDDGVAIAVRSGDARPSWSLRGSEAIDLFVAQIAWSEAEITRHR